MCSQPVASAYSPPTASLYPSDKRPSSPILRTADHHRASPRWQASLPKSCSHIRLEQQRKIPAAVMCHRANHAPELTFRQSQPSLPRICVVLTPLSRNVCEVQSKIGG